MQSGSLIHSSITGTERQLEQEEQQLSAQLAGFEQTINQAMTNRARLVSQLAENYMDPKVAGELSGRLNCVTTMLNQMQLAKSQRRTTLQGLLAQAKQRQSETMATLTTAKDEARAIDDSLAAKKNGARTLIEARDDWKTLSDKIQRRASEITAAQKAKTQAEAVLAGKRGGYEKNAFFKYLYRRPRPSLFPWIRWGDEWLAGRMNYPEQKARYERLLARPKLIDAIITSSRAEQSAWDCELQRITDEVENQFGVPQLRHILEQKNQTKETISRQISSLTGEINSLEGELQGIMTNDSEFERNLKKEIAGLLSQVSTDQLAAAAAQTQTDADDKLVAEIRQLEGLIASTKQSANTVQSQLIQKQTQVEGMHNLRRRFETENYETHRSQFSNSFDINSLLLGYLAGQVTDGHLWNQISAAQSWQREVMHQPPGFGSGSGSGSSWGDWGSSSSSSGGCSSSSSSSDWSSSGGAGGGGWSTTGGI